MAVQCILVGKGKDDVFIAVYGETTFDKVLKAYNENKVVQVIYQNRIYYLDNTTVVDSPEAFSFISAFSNQNDETGEIKHYVISLMTGDSWSGPFLQNSTPATHARTHAKNGTDPLAPADIGAMELSENILKQSNEDITSQVAQALSKNLVPFSGGTMTGLLNVLTPVGDSNATTKKYVDDALSEKIGMDGIGDLHVWRKTVVTKDPVPEVPGSYTLGSATITNLARMTSNGYNAYAANILVSKEIKVNLDGSVELVSPTSRQMIVSGSSESYTIDVNSDELLGAGNRYFTPSKDSESNSSRCTLLIPPGTVYYVAPGTTYMTAERSIGFTSAFNAAQLVTGVPGTPAIPAGTTTTYPVSTNPNAYQEGNDAKPAGYTLGEVVTGSFRMSDTTPRNAYLYKYANSVAVKENGEVVLQNPEAVNFNSDSYIGYESTVLSLVAGKFLYYYGRDSMAADSSAPDTQPPFNATPSEIVYVPADAAITATNTYPTGFYLDKYQPVTGYAAIPAGTTIEYLGKLGDKARVQVVSYVGTGTYGESNPCSLTFDFPPKIVIFIDYVHTSGTSRGNHYVNNYSNIYYEMTRMTTEKLTDDYTQNNGFGGYSSQLYGKKANGGKTIIWYAQSDSDYQGNSAGFIYTYLGIG